MRLSRRRWLGTGAGTFVSAAGRSHRHGAQYGALDRRRRRALRLVSGRGHCGAGRARSCSKLRGPLLVALATALLVWIVTSLVAYSGGEPHHLAAARADRARRAPCVEEPERLAACFRHVCGAPRRSADARLAAQPNPSDRRLARACLRRQNRAPVSRRQRQSPDLSRRRIGDRGRNSGQDRRHLQGDSPSPASMAAPTPWMRSLPRR